ncbi:hypothetical protein LWI28_005644 [Acer negundo]|uniref:Uncharacterized protein n=1 Tax=Acer negundo TaxID=4023 RepID=A0AAD5ISN3_ACENE|nr:hypothetical protein LWI28_005644 [Acer negundo]KAK4845912.1 hypothetical protein QYF36_010560 [Acer negundo]
MAANSPDSQVTISIGPLASSLKQMLAGHNLSMPSKACIFEVPKILRRHNPQAYEPNAFSIGPFRYGQEKLKPTEKIKLKYLQGLLDRKSKELTLEQLIGAVSAIAEEARQCYAGSSIGTCSTDEEFVKILVLDGCFIIELFLKDDRVIKAPDDDPIFSMSCLLEFLKHDLILLENQIPWLVLERLYNMIMVPQKKNLIQLALNFFSNMFSSHKPSITPDLFAKHEIKHILHLLRLSLVLPLDQSNKDTGWQPFPCARKIKGSGIKFKNINSNTILDIRFNNGVLEIPPLLVQETTETIFRNLISLEQCLPNCPPIITAYAKLMDNLIDTPEDVEILCENEVLDNWLNPGDATRFFNNLYNDAYVKTFYYHDVCQQVNDYSKRWWPEWRYFYTQNYFTRPWVIVSQIVAVIFLILGFLQTFYTIASYLSQKGKSS